MENLPEIISNLQDKKNENDFTLNQLQNISPETIKELDQKILRHSKVINYVIYFLAIWLILLSTAGVTGYLRLDDRIISESRIFGDRFDDERRYLSLRIDECISHKNEK